MKCGVKERSKMKLFLLYSYSVYFPLLHITDLFFKTVFQAILAGDFILSAASMALARIGNITVVKVLSQVIEDLVRGTVHLNFYTLESCK